MGRCVGVGGTPRRLTPEEIVRVESAPPRIAIIVGDKRGGRSMASTAARSKHVDNADVETLLPRTSHASHEIELSEVIHGQHEIEEVVEAQPVLVASRTPLEILRTCYNRHPSLRLGFLGLTVAVLCLFVIWTFKHSSDVSSPNTNVSYPEIAKIQASDGRPGDQFGWSFGVDGEYMIVGSPWYSIRDSSMGKAYVFKRTDDEWGEEAHLEASDGSAGDMFGWSIDTDGEHVVVGAPWYDHVKGCVYIFKRSGIAWSEEAKLTASDGAAGDAFGYSVFIMGDFVIVGAPQHREGVGGYYMFQRSGTNWNSVPTLSSRFSGKGAVGFAVTGNIRSRTEGDVVLGSAGAAFVIDLNSEQVTRVISDDTPIFGNFGYAVSISGDYLVVGEQTSGSEPIEGSVYVFARVGTEWRQQVRLTSPGGAAYDCFGRQVYINGDYIAVGADSDGPYDQGSAYIYTRSGSKWTQAANLTASDGTVSNYFGEHIVISGDTIAVGAPGDRGGPTGKGAVYVYKIQST